MTRLKVLLVDDHQLIRAGVRLLLESLDGIEVVGELSRGKEAIAGVDSLQPDLVLLDISLPDISGLEVLNCINAAAAVDRPRPRVIILSMHAQKDYVVRALRAGAAGYLLKESAPDELEVAIKAVLAGEQWLSPALRERMDGRRVLPSNPDHPTDPTFRLSPRQTDVLKLIASGMGTKEIAYELAISAKTVETHRGLLMEKLGIHDTAGLVRFAIRHGVIEP